MANNADQIQSDDDLVLTLSPAQLGALVALAISVIVLWRVARRDRQT